MPRIPTHAFRGSREVCTLCEGNDSSRYFRSVKYGVLVCRVCANGGYQEHYKDPELVAVPHPRKPHSAQ